MGRPICGEHMLLLDEQGGCYECEGRAPAEKARTAASLLTPREFWIDQQDADDEANYAGSALFRHPQQGPLLWQQCLIHVREVTASEITVPRETWEKVERALENSCACITSREPCSACEAFAAMRNL